LTLNADGSFAYTPDADFSGADSFTYVANDGTVDSAAATVNLTVTPVNDAPVAVDDNHSTFEDTPLTIAAPGVLGNDKDAEGDPLTTVLVTGPANGSLTLSAEGAFSYTPNAGFTGNDGFTYVANDGTGSSNVATVAFAVTGVNDAPVAINDSYSTFEDTALSISAPGLLENDTDPDGNSLTALLVTGPANGTFTLNAEGAFTYTPSAHFNGTDSFTYRASDGLAVSNIATVNLTVTPVNDPPVADAGPDQSVLLNETVTLNGAGSSDPDGDPLTFSWRLVSLPAGSTATLSDPTAVNPMFVADIAGTFIAELLVNDGLVNSAADRVTIAAVDPDGGGSTACSPTVSWGTGGDFDPARGETLQDAQMVLPKNSVSVLGIMPGEYFDVVMPWVGPDKGDVTICGIGPGRPVLHSTGGRISFGDIDRGSVRNLEIVRGGIVMRNGRWSRLDVEGVFLHDNTLNCIETGKMADGYWANVTLTDVELARCGQGNTKHNVYFSTRRGSLTATRVKSYAANESHAFKSTFENHVIKDSYFSTVADWSNPDSGPWSTTLVDISSCGQFVMTGSHLKATANGNNRGSLRVLQFRARRTMTGCDLPPYDGAEFWSQAFWDQVTGVPIDDPSNTMTFQHYVSDTVFEWVVTDPAAYLNTKIPGIEDDGTYPRDPVFQFSICSKYRSSPPAWVERAVTFTGNITWIGFQTRHRQDFAECKDDASSDPDAIYPPPPRPIVSVGGEDGTPVTLPSWFRTD
jgi:VCBS repeat-containing protein